MGQRKERTIIFKGEHIDVEDTEVFSPSVEYTIKSFIFIDAIRGPVSDGCEFEIRKSTRVMTLVEEEYSCNRVCTEGKGYYLGLDPQGEIVCYELGPHLGDDRNPVLTLEYGWTDCYIAGDQPGVTHVIDISTPPFRPNFEKEVPVGAESNALGVRIPSEYWHYYHTLRSGDQAEIAKLNITHPNQ